MRKKRKFAAAACALVLLLCLGATMLYTSLFIWSVDTKPPVISLPSDTIEAPVSVTDDELLEGVTAIDNRDGDVTDGILIQGVSDLTEDTVTVTYAAFDAAGNVSKAIRTLRYTDYEPPRFGLQAPLVFAANSSVDVLSQFTVKDMLDGDISSRIKASMVSNTGSLGNVGVHQVEFRVTNSLGDTSYLTLPVDVYDAGEYNAAVELKTYLTYVHRGDKFDPEDYLVGLRLLGDTEPITDLDEMEIRADSNVNIRKPGVYSVRYTVRYSNGFVEYVGYTRLNVVVEE